MSDADSTLNVARRLSLSVRSRKIYGPDHPHTVSNIEALGADLAPLLAAEDTVLVVAGPDALLVQEIPQPIKESSTAFLFDAMRTHGVLSIGFLPGVPREIRMGTSGRWLLARPIADSVWVVG